MEKPQKVFFFCKQVQISYVIRPHIDQNTQESRTTASNKGKWTFTPRKGTILIKIKGYDLSEKRHGAQEKGMALQEKGMAQHHAKRA